MIKDAFSQKKNVETKASFSDLVTETDKRVEDSLFSTIRQTFPSHCFIGEESTSAGAQCELTDRPTWIIDPIDGTTNFVHTFPFTCISIGFLVNKKAMIGIIYNPVLDDMYTARAGHGAFCNDKKIHVSGCNDYSQALLIIDTGACAKNEDIDCHYENMRRHKKHSRGIRAIGSAALSMCLVACGAADAYYEFGIHCWDMAAGVIIVEEAGGTLCGPDGSTLNILERSCLVTSSKKLAQDMVKDITIVHFPSD
ncbi:inositol monophosphatase 1-like isoform X2 [Lineus longissimus]